MRQLKVLQIKQRPSLSLSVAALRGFEAVVRNGGLSGAAAELGLSISALSHQLRGLQAAFPQPLLLHQGRRLVPTETGARLAADLDVAFTRIEAALARARQDRPSLTVTVQPAFAARWLIPRLPRFEAQGIDLRLLTTARLVDLGRERVDCAIRLGSGDWPGVGAQHLAVHYEAPLLRAGLDPKTTAQVHLTGRADEWAHWPDLPTRGAHLTVTSREHVVDAVLSGLGAGVIDTLVAATELESGVLVPLAQPRASGWSYWFVWPARDRISSAVAGFRDWLAGEFAEAA